MASNNATPNINTSNEAPNTQSKDAATSIVPENITVTLFTPQSVTDFNKPNNKPTMPPPKERSFLRSSQHSLSNIVNKNNLSKSSEEIQQEKEKSVSDTNSVTQVSSHLPINNSSTFNINNNNPKTSSNTRNDLPNTASENDKIIVSDNQSINNNNVNNAAANQMLLFQQEKEQALFQLTNFQYYDKEKQNLVFSELAHLEDFCHKEKSLIEDYKSKLTPNLRANELESITKHFSTEMNTLWTKKSRALSYIVEGSETSPFIQNKNLHLNDKPMTLPLPPLPNVGAKLTFLQQPSETAIANRYMIPAPAVCLVPGFKANNSTYIVSVSLAYHGIEDELSTTIDGKHEMLQGIKKVTVDSSGSAIFGKLKIMEVSSKHKHQPFCLVFSLEEYTDSGNKHVIATVKSAPFHVQSRPNKRKSTGSLPPAKHFFPNSATHLMPSFDNRAISSPSVPTMNKEEYEKMSFGTQSAENVRKYSSSQNNVNNSGEGEDENYIDITDLLILPQKEAAKRLGISESMLCKRFKECTKRKWPYRYLRKIDKVISTLTVHKNDADFRPKEDKEKLEKLTREREECLQPVKIRITTGDKIQDQPKLGKKVEYEDEEIPDEVLETLETMRMGKEKTDSSSKVPFVQAQLAEQTKEENNQIINNNQERETNGKTDNNTMAIEENGGIKGSHDDADKMEVEKEEKKEEKVIEKKTNNEENIVDTKMDENGHKVE